MKSLLYTRIILSFNNSKIDAEEAGEMWETKTSVVANNLMHSRRHDLAVKTTKLSRKQNE